MDLHSVVPYWLLRNGLVCEHMPLRADAEVDVLVVGAGITGALVAERISRTVPSVMVLDKRDVCQGSTAASTALLQWEIDTMLHELIDMVGEDHAVQAYHMGIDAIKDLENLCHTLPVDVGFAKRSSLMLARDVEGDRDKLEKEFACRLKHGLPVEWLDEQNLLGIYGMQRPAAVRTDVAAEVDPYKLAHALLHRIAQRGVPIHDQTDVTRFERENGRVVAVTDQGPVVKAKWVVMATGYESSNQLPGSHVDLYSTFALVTQRMASFGHWDDRALVWETGEDYLYMRTTPDRRILVGGADEPFKDPDLRESVREAKANELLERAAGLLGELPLRKRMDWAGVFGKTKDGLPHIGEHPDLPGQLWALGYGGNGITFSTIAAWILHEMVQGKHHEAEAMYAFNRTN